MSKVAVPLHTMVRGECERSGVPCRVDTVTLPGDADLLRRMVRNLLDNARIHGGGLIHADLKQTDHRIELVISDNGPGLPETEYEAIFLPFYRREEDSDGTQREGSGLGLAIVRQVAEVHGGSVRYEHPADQQSRFIVEFPRS